MEGGGRREERREERGERREKREERREKREEGLGGFFKLRSFLIIRCRLFLSEIHGFAPGRSRSNVCVGLRGSRSDRRRGRKREREEKEK